MSDTYWRIIEHTRILGENSERYTWSVASLKGPKRAAHLWLARGLPSREWRGGMVIHKSWGEGEPDHDYCLYLDGKGWCDGSTLAAEEWKRHAKEDGLKYIDENVWGTLMRYANEAEEEHNEAKGAK